MSESEVWMSWDYDSEIPPSFSDVQLWESREYAQEQLLLREGHDPSGKEFQWVLHEETGIYLLHINQAYAGIRLKAMTIERAAK